MDWKKYRAHFAHNKIDESHFVLGVDMGNATSAISFFDPLRRVGEVLDISGGYGKAAAPTVLQHIADSGEWIFGEYAVLNANGADPLLTGFVGRLGGGDNAAESSVVYLKELVANCRSINPKAQIAGIVAVVPDFVTPEIVDVLRDVYRAAGYGDALIAVAEEREALLTHYLYNEPGASGRVMLLDFGDRGMRGGVYNVDGGEVECLSVNMDVDLSTAAVDEGVYDLFAGYYCENRGEGQELSAAETAQLTIFTHQHKDMLFQPKPTAKQARLYFNFTYPPFSRQVAAEDVWGIVGPLERVMTDFVAGMLGKIPGANKSVDTIICTGGGFEMPWAKRRIASLFGGGDVRFYKNSKGILAEGASLMAAERLGLLPDIGLNIIDSHKMPWDIGVQVGGGFYPIVRRGTWLGQECGTAYFILQDDDDKIVLYSRDEKGGEKRIGMAVLGGLPRRPVGTTKIAVDIIAKTAYDYMVNIRDVGFGEMFPASGYVYNGELSVSE
ncbi:MAG: DUF5716 family protein [Defluviitaleaceae bacterium]|nr:DUF5716 family protein [Defluviitaleaceae bacterium]